MDKSKLGAPETLAPARIMAHAAAQLLYRAAVANLAPMPGDEHSNLGWDPAQHAFQTHALAPSRISATLQLAPLALGLGDTKLPLDGVPAADALAWMDQRLTAAGLRPASGIKVTYDLPAAVTGLTRFANTDGLAALAAWFDLAAAALQGLADGHFDIEPGPSPVRCWPHHFRHRHLCRPRNRRPGRRARDRSRHVAGRRQLRSALFLRQSLAAPAR